MKINFASKTIEITKTFADKASHRHPKSNPHLVGELPTAFLKTHIQNIFSCNTPPPLWQNRGQRCQFWGEVVHNVLSS